MSDWTSGYVADIGYTYGYYHELNPLRLRLALLHAGLAPPEVRTACELGYGQGLSINMHAAASPIEWWGTDFNPGQAAFAMEMAKASGANVHLHDEAFASFCSRTDIPDFDYIGVHGIWSWISEENRAVIVDFIRRKLKVGGVAYLSYNTMPGWSPFAPMRHLLTEHAEYIGSEGHGLVSRINGALDFANKLMECEPLFARANPTVADRLKKLQDHNRHYLAHEYFNLDWSPMHFAEIARELATAKVSFACSAHYLDHIDLINMKPKQQLFVNAVPDATLRETVRDFMVNQQFRRDYWIKGPRKLPPLERLERLQAERVVLTVPRSAASLKATGTAGEVTMQEQIYVPILDALADHKPRSIMQLMEVTAGKKITSEQLVQAVIVLVGTGQLAPVQPESATDKARARTDRLNAYVMNRARSSGDIGHVASPVTGGGQAADRIVQLFLLALKQGRERPADWVASVWDVLKLQDQKLVKDGSVLKTADENKAELGVQAAAFEKNGLPMLKALGVVDADRA